MIYDFIIVGSGISGLNTARLLIKKYPNRKICIIEKKNKIGGLINTKYKNPENIKLEAGAAVIYEYQKHILRLVKKYNIETFNINLSENFRNFYECKNNNSTNSDNSKIYSIYINNLRKVFKYMATL